MSSLPLRTRMALAFGLGFFVLGAVLLGAVAVFVGGAAGPATDEVAARLAEELGVPATPLSGVEIVAPDGRSIPAVSLFDTVTEVTDDVRRDVGRRLLLTLPVLAAVAAAAGWWLAGRAVRPLDAMTEVARRVSSDRLDARVDYDGPRDEIHELADAVDRMMERLEHAFTAQGAFAAAVSHELRTPLSIIRTELDVLLAGPDPTREELEDVTAAVREAVGRSERTIAALLDLARSGIVDPVDEVDFGSLTRDVVDEVTLGYDVDVQLELDPAPAVRGDPQLLGRLVRNLIDNACRHNVPVDGWLHVDGRSDGGDVLLVVANSGPVLEPAVVQRLGEPFYRGVSGRQGVPGTGLGLVVTRSIVEGHGGSMEVTGRPSGGLRVEVRLPLPQPMTR